MKTSSPKYSLPSLWWGPPVSVTSIFSAGPMLVRSTWLWRWWGQHALNARDLEIFQDAEMFLSICYDTEWVRHVEVEWKGPKKPHLWLARPSRRHFTFFFIFNSVDFGLTLLSLYIFVVAECGRKAPFLPPKLDGHVCVEHIHRSVGPSRWIRDRRVGQHQKLHQASGHLWALCQVLPVPKAHTHPTSPTPLSRPESNQRGPSHMTHHPPPKKAQKEKANRVFLYDIAIYMGN